MTADSRKLDVIGGIAGIFFAVLFVAGVFVQSTPNENTAAGWSATFSSSGDRATFIIGGYLWIIAALALLVMVAAEWKRYGSYEGVSGVCASVAGMCTVAFSATLLVGATLTAAVAGNKAFGGMPIPESGEIVMQLTNTGAAIVLLGGGLAATLGLAAVSMLIIRERGPRWLAILGLIAAIACVFSVTALPIVALPIWVLIASITLLMHRASTGVHSGKPVPAT